MLISAILLGLLSSLHCVGMCGPIAMMLPVDRNNPVKKVIQLMLYHLGRITAYGSLGLVFGLLGKGLYLAGLQQQLSIIAGILMIAIVMIPERTFAKYNFSRPVYKTIGKVKAKLGQQFNKHSYKSFYLTGLFNGYLPCGLVYAALFGAVTMQNQLYGAAYMVLYGLGTIPLMSAVVYFRDILSAPLRLNLYKMVPYAMVFIGMLFIMRGLGLGIPFISPADTNLFIQHNADCVLLQAD